MSLLSGSNIRKNKKIGYNEHIQLQRNYSSDGLRSNTRSPAKLAVSTAIDPINLKNLIFAKHLSQISNIDVPLWRKYESYDVFRSALLIEREAFMCL